MRISVIAGDPDRVMNPVDYRVTLNGVEQRDCLVADADKGMILRYKRNRMGLFSVTRVGIRNWKFMKLFTWTMVRQSCITSTTIPSARNTWRRRWVGAVSSWSITTFARSTRTTIGTSNPSLTGRWIRGFTSLRRGSTNTSYALIELYDDLLPDIPR